MEWDQWNEKALLALIGPPGVEECQTLEYKAAAAIGNKDEISKDVSAMANAGGGTIIYGVAEFRDPTKKHFPEKIDPIDRRSASKEYLEQVINSNIRPKIDGLKIKPVVIGGKDELAAYVVTVPQGSTAHQANDQRYHRRYNFEVQRMHDHEIRDVMARAQHPIIDLEFRIHLTTHRNQFKLREDPTEHAFLKVHAHNKGSRLAQYVNTVIKVPGAAINFIAALQKGLKPSGVGDAFHFTTRFSNTKRDDIGPAKGPSYYTPLLPGDTEPIGSAIELAMIDSRLIEQPISWTVFADSAPQRSGEIKLVDVLVIDERIPLIG